MSREPVTRARAVAAAIALADEGGLSKVTMRGVAKGLGVEAMSLYHHVANKNDLLDGMVDGVFDEIGAPPPGEWRPAIASRCHSMRDALNRHRWAVGLLDSRTAPGDPTLAHHESVLSCLRESGFSVRLSAHAFAALDAFVVGFVTQEVALPFDEDTDMEEMVEGILAGVPEDRYPRLREMTVEHVLQPGYDFGDEFAYGLDLVLDGLERALANEQSSGAA